MKNLPKRTIQKLEMIKACILATPELYNQNKYPRLADGHKCGSPCCLAGWAVWVNNPNPEEYDKRLRKEGIFTEDTLVKELGITDRQADLLFAGFPDECEDAFRLAETQAGAEAGARRIDLFIASDGTV